MLLKDEVNGNVGVGVCWYSFRSLQAWKPGGIYIREIYLYIANLKSRHPHDSSTFARHVHICELHFLLSLFDRRLRRLKLRSWIKPMNSGSWSSTSSGTIVRPWPPTIVLQVDELPSDRQAKLPHSCIVLSWESCRHCFNWLSRASRLGYHFLNFRSLVEVYFAINLP
jgi:hypothetical protein